MQNREQIQKEIDAIRLQLNLADMSAITAPEEEKGHWDEKRSALQSRLEELQKNLEESSVVYDGDHAASILSEEDADEMLKKILSAQENDATDTMADAMLNRILTADETQIPSQDEAALGKILFTEEPTAPTADKMADAMIENILATPAPAQPAPPSQDDISDAQADEMLRQILMQTEEPPIAEPQNDISDAQADEMLRKILQAEPEPAETPAWQTEQAEEQTREQKAASEPAAQEQTGILPDDFAARLNEVRSAGGDADASVQIERLKLEAEDAFRRANAALAEAERMRKEAEQIKLNAETERAMYAAEMELQRGLRSREENMRQNADRAEKDRIAEKIARRKAEITAIRNGLQEVKDSDAAFAMREKLFAVQLVLDEDERNSPEISYLLTKSMDDLAHALEVAELKRRIASMVAAQKAAAKKAAAHKKAVAKKTAEKKVAARKAAEKKAAAKKAAAKKKAMARRRMMMHARRPASRT